MPTACLYLLHSAVVLLLPDVVLIQQRFVLSVLRRHGFEEDGLSLDQPGRPLAPKRDYLLALCCVVVRGALAPVTSRAIKKVRWVFGAGEKESSRSGDEIIWLTSMGNGTV